MVGNVPINHVSFSKMSKPEVGMSLFSQALSLFCTTSVQFRSAFPDKETPSPIKIICLCAESDTKYANLLVAACLLFFGRAPAIDGSLDKLLFLSDKNLACRKCGFTFQIPQITDTKSTRWKKQKQDQLSCPKCGGICAEAVDFVINEGNIEDIISVLKLRNGLGESEEDEGNPANETVRRLIEKRNEMRKKLKRLKGEENKITIWELIDIFSSIMKMPYQEVMEYDIYQFNIQFARMRAYDDYEVGIQSLLHGAKKEDVKLQHYIRKLNDDQDD
jgi:hypothetical protein